MDGPKVALYLRLSRDDEREGESASIENQRSCLRQYVAARGWQVAGEYADDGYSGLNFDRPQFKRLLDDLERGSVDTVLTKDLSRLGRDQIFTAFYYQIYFPQRGVRYIAVAEGLDTAQGSEASVLFPFLTAANDFYTADISRKVRAALTARKREGKFIGAQPPLGYAKDPAQPGHLVVDGEGAAVIRSIFFRYLKLGSVAGVARQLTAEGIPTPSQIRGGSGGRFSGLWSATMVRRVLTNPTYAGHLTQNRRVKVNYKVTKRKELPREEWITVPNTHEAIVDQKTFDQVQGLLTLHSYQGEHRGEGHLLTGLVFCADCGSPMTYNREGNRTYLVCQGYRRGGSLKLCTSHRVREDWVLQTVRGVLHRLGRGVDRDALKLERAGTPSEAELHLARLERELECQMNMLTRLYQDRVDDRLTEGEFWELAQRCRERRTALEEQRRKTWKELAWERQVDGKKELERLLSFEDLDRGELAALVERVAVHGNKSLTLTLRFRPPGRTTACKSPGIVLK